jgi:hypothetical protein
MTPDIVPTHTLTISIYLNISNQIYEGPYLRHNGSTNSATDVIWYVTSRSLVKLSMFQRILMSPSHVLMTEAVGFSRKSIKFYKFIPVRTGSSVCVCGQYTEIL